MVVRYVRAKCDELGCKLHAAEAASDHMHVLVSVPPDMKLSNFVRDIKGGSSHLVNHEMNLGVPFYWQRGSGVVSVSGHDKARIVEYIRRQREKHEAGDVWPSLERCEDTGDSPSRDDKG